MRFESTTETLDSTLTLPLSTGEYEIPAINAKDGLVLKERMNAFEGAARRINAGEDPDAVRAEIVNEHDMTLEELGELGEMSLSKEVRDKMLEDGVGLRELEVAEMTAFFFHTVSDNGETAEKYWKSGGKVQTPNRAQRRTATQTRQGAATTTKKQASRTGTKPKAAASKAKASSGRKSSSTGTTSK